MTIPTASTPASTPTGSSNGHFAKYTDAIAALPQEAFLGTLVFYSISDANVHLEQAREHLAQAGVPIEGLRKTLRPMDAYVKATKEFAIKVGTEAGIRSEFLVRPLGDDEEGMQRQVVIERAVVNPSTGQKRQLFYEPAADLFFQRGVKKKGTYVGHEVNAERKEGTYASMTPVEKQLFDEAFSSFPDRFDHLLNYMDSHAVRTFIRNCIDNLQGIQVKSSGGLYFVAQQHTDVINAVRDWVRTLTNRKGQHTCEFHTLPLLNLADQREMIVEAFQEELVDEIQRMIKDIKKITDDPERVIEERTFYAYSERGAELAGRIDSYSTMLGQRAEIADLSMSTFNANLIQLTGRIKGKPSMRIPS